MWSRLFPNDDGIIRRISSNDNANAQYHTYSYHAEVGKNQPRNIKTINVWNEKDKKENEDILRQAEKIRKSVFSVFFKNSFNEF